MAGFTARLAANAALAWPNARGGGGGGEKEGGREGGGSSLENLNAMVAGVSHDHAPVAVDGDAAKRLVELPVA